MTKEEAIVFLDGVNSRNSVDLMDGFIGAVELIAVYAFVEANPEYSKYMTDTITIQDKIYPAMTKKILSKLKIKQIKGPDGSIQYK